MFTSTLFRRLFLPFLLLICAAVVVPGAFEARQLRDTYLERTGQALRDNARLMAELVGPNLGPDRQPELARQVKALGEALGCRVTVVAADGRVVADNEADPAAMENHRLRPEIVAAVSQGEGVSTRTSATVNEGMLYYARRVGGGGDGGNPPHYLRLAVHLRQLHAELRVLYTRLAWAAAASLAVAGAIGYYVARRRAAPLVELTAFAQDLAGGNLDRRVPPPAERGEVAALATALNSMAESLSRLIAQAAKDKAELLAILAGMSEGVVATDTHQRIRLSNAAAADLMGFAAARPDGKLLWEVVRHEAILTAAAAVLETREPADVQVGPVSNRHLRVAVRPFPPTGEPEGLVIVAHDTTQSVRYQELRKQFVANVSHELRTPLTLIKGFAETLADGALQDPVRGPQFLATIGKHADQLTNLVNDLLDLSRLEGHPDVPQCAAVDVAATVRAAVDLLRPAAHKKGQDLTVACDPGLPPVAGNADYLERAVANLVDNAVKYTPDGGRITVTAAADVADGHEGHNGDGHNGDPTGVVVTVSDSGIGIPAGDLPRIFERFYRVDRSRSRDMGGTGLGLSIVKHVAQAHGGTVDVSSTPGAGSVFRLKFPAQADLD